MFRKARPFLQRYFGKTDVTICIPAYNAAKFIDRTLRCAQGQIYRRVRILVSVDRSTDDTAEICRGFARDDSRIEVIEQRERQNWTGNVNALLAKADTPFFFLYFHDDFILPQYCGELRAALRERTDAASANCDLFKFGTSEQFSPGKAYEGSVAKRLITLWALNSRGKLLRAMIRRERIGADYRLPPEDQHAIVPGMTLLMRMVAAGPSVHVPKTLYLRWEREDGLMAAWRKVPHEKMIADKKADVVRAFALIDELIADEADRKIAKYAHATRIMTQLKRAFHELGQDDLSLSEIHPDAPLQIEFSEVRRKFGPEIADSLTELSKKASKPLGARR